MRHAATMALQGHRAGFLARLVADAVDSGVVWAIGLAALLRAVLYVLFPAGLLWVLVSRRNGSIQALVVVAP
jgi:hypothetical protein